MSVYISGIKITIEQDDSDALEIVRKKYGIKQNVHIYKKSIDARRGQISKVITVTFDLENEEEFVKKANSPHVRLKNKSEEFKPTGLEKIEKRPVIIGFGPAGLFTAYELSKHGYKPIVFEGGGSMEQRDLAVSNFFTNGVFDKNSNVQFGEGGAGSYSDGKLTTRINDARCDYILNILKEHGAPSEILYLAKPHIGTDILKKVVVNIRESIKKLGGEIHFNSKVTDFKISNGQIKSVFVGSKEIEASTVILAIGHSSRDTFYKIFDKGIFIEPKAFAVGARIEHLQDSINESLYGKYKNHKNIPVGEYNLTHTQNGIGCYTFCMCPGGVVVPSNSEENMVVTNGMSYHARDGKNANSAVVVTVNPNDFEGNSPLAGVEFQRKIERQAFLATGKNYYAPTCLVGDFLDGRVSNAYKSVKPTYEIGTAFSDFNNILPSKVTQNMATSLRVFERKMRAFGAKDAVLTAPETRTSSPVRITRNENFESINTKGLYPCGEGAGYAGGIISAAVDGLKCAEKIMEKYKA